ncbi:MAG: hypothetical protein J6U30_03180, partial [Oscillospiraceae bacterium]|nr:hypothetical protein [Oscillospiraceae bacterium]
FVLFGLLVIKLYFLAFSNRIARGHIQHLLQSENTSFVYSIEAPGSVAGNEKRAAAGPLL